MKARGKHSSHCGALPLSESKVRTDQSVPVELTMSWSWAHHKVRVAGKKEECVQMVAALRSLHSSRETSHLLVCLFLVGFPFFQASILSYTQYLISFDIVSFSIQFLFFLQETFRSPCDSVQCAAKWACFLCCLLHPCLKARRDAAAGSRAFRDIVWIVLLSQDRGIHTDEESSKGGFFD